MKFILLLVLFFFLPLAFVLFRDLSHKMKMHEYPIAGAQPEGAFSPKKFSKRCIAIFTFLQKL